VEKSTHSAEYKRLLQLLREFRDETGLTQRQVADRLGKPQSWVSKYESGERRIDVIELGHILTALGVPKGLLLRRLDPAWLDTGDPGHPS